jgi:hypothetical protein
LGVARFGRAPLQDRRAGHSHVAPARRAQAVAVGALEDVLVDAEVGVVLGGRRPVQRRRDHVRDALLLYYRIVDELLRDPGGAHRVLQAHALEAEVRHFRRLLLPARELDLLLGGGALVALLPIQAVAREVLRHFSQVNAELARLGQSLDADRLFGVARVGAVVLQEIDILVVGEVALGGAHLLRFGRVVEQVFGAGNFNNRLEILATGNFHDRLRRHFPLFDRLQRRAPVARGDAVRGVASRRAGTRARGSAGCRRASRAVGASPPTGASTSSPTKPPSLRTGACKLSHTSPVNVPTEPPNQPLVRIEIGAQKRNLVKGLRTRTAELLLERHLIQTEIVRTG